MKLDRSISLLGTAVTVVAIALAFRSAPLVALLSSTLFWTIAINAATVLFVFTLVWYTQIRPLIRRRNRIKSIRASFWLPRGVVWNTRLPSMHPTLIFSWLVILVGPIWGTVTAMWPNLNAYAVYQLSVAPVLVVWAIVLQVQGVRRSRRLKKMRAESEYH